MDPIKLPQQPSKGSEEGGGAGMSDDVTILAKERIISFILTLL